MFLFKKLLTSTGEIRQWTRSSLRRTMSNYKPVTHVIFDIDGLLLDTEKLYKQVFIDIVAKYGIVGIPDETRNKVLGLSEPIAAKVFVEDLRLPITPKEFQEMQVKLQKERLPDAQLMAGAERLVKHLYDSQVPMGCASGSSEASIGIKTKRHGHLFNCMHHIVSGTHPKVKNGKPHPDIFLICAAAFDGNPSPSTCLVFEDAPNGVKGALAAGMQVVMVPDPNLPEELQKEATMVIKTLNDFKPQLFNLPPFPSDQQINR